MKSGCTAYLRAMSKAKDVGQTSAIIMYEFGKVFSVQVEMYKAVISSLTPVIKGHVTPINSALTKLGDTLTDFLKSYTKCKTACCRTQHDYTTVIKQHQLFLNKVTSHLETIRKRCKTKEHAEAVALLSFAIYYMTLSVQGMNSCLQDIQYEDNGYIPQPLAFGTQSLQYVLNELSRSVFAIQFPFTTSGFFLY